MFFISKYPLNYYFSLLHAETIDMEQVLKDATNDSETAQLKLGVHFLKLAECEIEKKENTDKAMKWLIAASKQGNVEATQKLRHCVVNNFGKTSC